MSQLPYQKEMKPNELTIVWGRDSRYWRIDQSGNEPAELLQVCWLEVIGQANVDPGKKYKVGFRVSMTSDAFGWKGNPIYIGAKLGKNVYTWKTVPLESLNAEQDIPDGESALIIDVPSGEFKPTIKFGLFEVWSRKWKGGLKIHHAFVREYNNN